MAAARCFAFHLVFASGLAALAAGVAAAQETATPVGTVSVAARPVAEGLSATGRVEAVDRVEIVARVQGFLLEVAFEEGQSVAAGDLLYRIEPDAFAAAVRRAEGALAQATAERDLADIQLARAQELLDRQVGTEVARDQARAEALRAAGAVASAEAELARARLELSYTEIRSPVAGRIGRTALTRGAVVGPASGPLAVVVSQDPMHVAFPVSARAFLRGDGTSRKGDPSAIRVRLRLADGSFHAAEGRIDFIDVAVDRATDTVMARATIPNPNRDLIDGQLLTVLLEEGAPAEKPVIPQQALIADQGGLFVMVVEEGRAATRRVRAGQPVGPEIVVTEGLAVGDLVIVEGLERVRPGMAVLAQPVAAQAAAGTD